MKDLILYIVKQLANQPDKVSVTETEQDGAVKLQLIVAEEDKGKIIGREGRVIKAIRALAFTAASKLDKKVLVEID